jgi:hypothetical protein
MPRDPNKGNQKQSRNQQAIQKSSASWLHQSPDWPVYQVLLSEGWDKQDELATALVARQSPRSGKIAVASFLVDLACMGVKSSFVRICKSPEEYQRRVLRSLSEEQTFKPADFDLVAKIVAEGLAYAEKLGISPDPEYHQAQRLLAGANPAACTVDVPLGGPEGKPHFIAGPYDDVEQIMATLTRTVGPEGFNYTVFQKDPMPMPDIGGLFGMQKK